MRVQRALAAGCIVLPGLVLLSFGCGIIALPFTAPDVIATNNHRLRFTVRIVDEEGKPVDGVKAEISAHSRRLDPLIGEADHYGYEDRAVNGELRYDRYGVDYVTITYKKEGYDTGRFGYQVHYRAEGDDGFAMGEKDVVAESGGLVNVAQHPTSVVVLRHTNGGR